MPQTVETDVLVIGGGGAGFRAAIGAREKGARCLLLSKGPLARSGATPLAGADLTCDGQGLRELGFFGEPRDSKQKWFSDIVHQGFFLNNQKMVELYVNTAPQRVGEIVEWGAKVNFSEERALFTSGTAILDALRRRARDLGAEFADDVMAIDLLTAGGRVVGAVGLNVLSGEFIVYKCKAVILATGGWHKAYWPNTGTKELTGEGQAMAYRAGAELANMEFVTFCANVLLWPPRWIGSIFLYVMHLMIGGDLVNSKGQDIMAGFDPDMVKYGTNMEWNKCFISVLSALQVRAGNGSEHGGVIYRVGKRPWEQFDAAANGFYPNWQYKKNDFSELRRMFKEGEPVEVGPAVEYFEAGVSMNELCETTLPGLYGSGEVGLSLFGANRVAAATTEMLVTGARSGSSAGEYAAKTKQGAISTKQVDAIIDRCVAPLSCRDGVKPIELRQRIQTLAHTQLGPVKNEKEIAGFIAMIEGVMKDELPHLCTAAPSRQYNKEWLEAIELQNMVTNLDLSARCALLRKESRGVHYREDYPNCDNDNWLKESTVKLVGEKPQIGARPVTVTSLSLPTGVVPYWDMVKRMMLAHSEVGGHH